MALPELSLVLLLFLVGILASGVWIAVGLGLVGLLAMNLVTDVPIGQVLATTVWSSTASWTLAFHSGPYCASHWASSSGFFSPTASIASTKDEAYT